MLLVLGSLGACGHAADDTAVHVSLAPSLLFPQGLLDGVTKLTVSVYDAASGLDCDPATGKLTQTAKPFAQADLGTSLAGGACPSGGKFCGQLSIAKSGTPRLFQAQAQTTSNPEVADGCTKVVVDQDAQPLKIVMIRNVPPAVCGNKTIESTEQCEPPDPTCDAKCHTTEQLLSTDGASGEKSAPFFLWPAQAGDGGRLLAFFGDKTPNSLSTSRSEISMRVMSDTFAPLANFPSSTYLPNDQAAQTAKPQPGAKSLPSAAVIGSQYFVVFDDDSGTSQTPDIHLRSMDASFTAQQAFGAPVVVNNPPDGEPGIQTAPAIVAGPNGLLFIAWQDDGAQKIAGRTYKPGAPGVLGPQQDISSGSGNKNVQLASTSNGWIAVWEGAGDIKLRSIDANGNAFGSETIVNENTQGQQDHPSIATLADGRFAVVWADHAATNATDIVGQRYTATASKVAGDQAAPVNTTVAGDQTAPRIAGMNAAGGSFAVAWLDGQTRHVRARLLGGSSGFLFNNVDGQSGDFQASIADGRPRAEPVIAVGGASPAIAIGWSDLGAAAPFGIVGRRFPLPK
jgi:hypothetical protein